MEKSERSDVYTSLIGILRNTDEERIYKSACWASSLKKVKDVDISELYKTRIEKIYNYAELSVDRYCADMDDFEEHEEYVRIWVERRASKEIDKIEDVKDLGVKGLGGFFTLTYYVDFYSLEGLRNFEGILAETEERE